MKKSLLALIALILVGALIAVGISCSNNIEDEIKLTKDEVASSQPEAVPSGSEGSGTQSGGNSGSTSAPTPAPVKKVSMTLPSVVDAGSTVTFSSAASNRENDFKYEAVKQLGSVKVDDSTNVVTVESSKIANNGSVIVSYKSAGQEASAVATEVGSSSSIETVDLNLLNSQPVAKRAADAGYTKEENEKVGEPIEYGKLVIVLEYFPEKGERNKVVDLNNFEFKLNGEKSNYTYNNEKKGYYVVDSATTNQLRIEFDSVIPTGAYYLFDLSFGLDGKSYSFDNSNLQEGYKDIRVSAVGTNNLWVAAGKGNGINDRNTLTLTFNDSRDYENVRVRVGESPYYNATKDSDGKYSVKVPNGTYNSISIMAETEYKGSYPTGGNGKAKYKAILSVGNGLSEDIIINKSSKGEVNIENGKMEAEKGLITIESFFATKYIQSGSKELEVKTDRDDENAMTIAEVPSYSHIPLSFTPVDSFEKNNGDFTYKIYDVKYHMKDNRYHEKVVSGYKGSYVDGKYVYDKNYVTECVPWMEPGEYTLTYNGYTFKVYVGSGESEFIVIGEDAKKVVDSEVLSKAVNKDLSPNLYQGR